MIRLAIQSIHEANQEICGHEVLARKIIDGDRVAAPGIFMAGSSGEDWFSLDMTVYSLVAQSAVLVNDPWPLFINMSPETLHVEAKFRRALSLVSDITKSRSASTVIEISEESDIAGPVLDKRLCDLKAVGALVAMDDFGVGFSNLQRLIEHDWSYCKIDLYSLAAADNLDWLIEAKVHCDQHRIGIVLERFESKDRNDLLQPFRNSLYQGYAFSRPQLLSEKSSTPQLSVRLG
jgi:EAL domain-containing protein (putative c-di-GMP-specific phosphodiesterase class I)